MIEGEPHYIKHESIQPHLETHTQSRVYYG